MFNVKNMHIGFDELSACLKFELHSTYELFYYLLVLKL